jgi:hypothetical protein
MDGARPAGGAAAAQLPPYEHWGAGGGGADRLAADGAGYRARSHGYHMSRGTVMLRKLARALIAWVERYADPADREWIGAMRAELDVIDGGLAQLRWAAGAVLVLWRPYRVELLRFMLCIAAVVAANYWYPKFAIGRPFELFFFAQQFYLPVVGILAAHATRHVLAGMSIGIGVSLLGFGFLYALGYGSPDATTLLANPGSSIYVQLLFFMIVGAALGTAGAATVTFPKISEPRPTP